ncbi:subtilisin-like serine-protease S [Pyrus x bretschneideri]|uniref:subtilisin-like serine-protease S n=1 Tax=Pyrus x bretschneideri TaxID=225117 RepID=UPI00202F1AAF|nr:subtilisin-like serine-protease S [Pyrus x bretschneideri]
MILIDQFDNFNEQLPSFDLPTSVISSVEGRKLSDYMATRRRPIAGILETREVIGVELAPKMALFSSRGPNSVTPDINIKPDITAPGVNILAAAPPSKNQAADAISNNMHSAKTKDNNGNTIRDRSGKPIPCSFVPVPPYFLNYPSIGIGAMSGHMSIYRTVTFKGGRKDPQIIKVSVDSPPDVASGA